MDRKILQQLADAKFPVKCRCIQPCYCPIRLKDLIDALGTGTGNSLFALYGHFTHDFGWEAKWTDIISLDPGEENVYRSHGETPEITVAKLFIKKANKSK